jgi:NAD(P)-dependent dehydrogenase (short-subunit alcohol dehydrogenase family)
MPGRLVRRTALVTGSTDGIGAAIAIAFAAEGAHVVVTGRNAERGVEVVETIAASGGRADFVEADLGGGAEAIGALVTAATTAAGPIDILVNNAAFLVYPMPTADVGERLIDRALAVNIKAALLLTGLVAPPMVANRSGVIINIGSLSGLVGSSGDALYSATKAALHAMTRTWAAEYGPAGVRVNTVAPGPTLTGKAIAAGEMLKPIIDAMPSGRAEHPGTGRLLVRLSPASGRLRA